MKTLTYLFALVLLLTTQVTINAQTLNVFEKDSVILSNDGEKDTKENKEESSTIEKKAKKNKKNRTTSEQNPSTKSEKEDLSYLFITP